MAKIILGIFSDRVDAETAVDDLREAGFEPTDISIVMKGEDEEYTHFKGGSVADTTFSGVATGAVVGGLAGILVGIGAIAIPGIGAVLIGGPLAAALGLTGAAATTIEGATTGALAGGLIGAFVGLGMSEEDARIFEKHIKNGGILVAVSTELDDADDVRVILEDNNARELRMLSTGPQKRNDRDYISGYGTFGIKGGRKKMHS